MIDSAKKQNLREEPEEEKVRGVDVAVRRLREKLEDDPAQPKYIITRRGAGYYFQKDL